ncbi:MAG: hypothetical protein AAB250_15955, partial [Bdellovibrionota bacterium]
MLSKQQLRSAFRANLERDDDRSAFDAKSRELAAQLVTSLTNESGIWAGFMPIGFEPDISS